MTKTVLNFRKVTSADFNRAGQNTVTIEYDGDDAIIIQQPGLKPLRLTVSNVNVNGVVKVTLGTWATFKQDGTTSI